MEHSMTVTHKLESKGQRLSVSLKQSKALCHSHTGKSIIGVVSTLEPQQGTIATYNLKSKGQALSAGFKQSKA